MPEKIADDLLNERKHKHFGETRRLHSFWYAACIFKHGIQDVRLGRDDFTDLLLLGLMWNFAPADRLASCDSDRLRNNRKRRPIPVATSEDTYVAYPPRSFLSAQLQEDLMLVLARKCGEAIIIPESNVVITILEKQGDRIRVGIEAPPDLMVHRREVWERIQKERGQAPRVERESHSSTSAPAVIP